MPETFLTLAYAVITIFNTVKLFNYKREIHNVDSLLVSNFIVIIVLLLLIIFDTALRVSKLNAEVYNVDTEVKRMLTEF